MNTETPFAVVQQYIDAFNRGDATAMAAIFDARGQILDGMPPHVWEGPTATLEWYRDVITESEAQGVSGYFVALGDPLHNDVTNNNAYVVVPATMRFDVNSMQVVQAGAVFTVALRKTEGRWHVAAWAWAKGKNKTQ